LFAVDAEELMTLMSDQVWALTRVNVSLLIIVLVISILASPQTNKSMSNTNDTIVKMKRVVQTLQLRHLCNHQQRIQSCDTNVHHKRSGAVEIAIQTVSTIANDLN
jgi:hypothetical protein